MSGGTVVRARFVAIINDGSPYLSVEFEKFTSAVETFVGSCSSVGLLVKYRSACREKKYDCIVKKSHYSMYLLKLREAITFFLSGNDSFHCLLFYRNNGLGIFSRQI